MVLSLALVPALAGCAEDGGGLQAISEALGAKKTLAGLCGHTYNDDWDQQVILDVTLDKNASKDPRATVEGLEVAAALLEDDQGHRYDERPTDEEGCVALRLQGAGDYNFWAFGEIPDSNCFLTGYLNAHYAGENDVVAGHVTVSKKC